METQIILLWALICICYFGFGINFIMKMEGISLLLRKTGPIFNFLGRFVFVLVWPIGGIIFVVLGFDAVKE